ncbi:hypothetical protein FZEAL_10201 [Fusarium zealandicum]|uniref:Uncharacterized protein n=1 Tax=Fusarium zealandicum TaxID=1053134 RepID=A0A8H4XC34_9HYPO|nr:hypothetical protein FZEAL_10201 [Fusarium zealandicum]
MTRWDELLAKAGLESREQLDWLYQHHLKARSEMPKKDLAELRENYAKETSRGARENAPIDMPLCDEPTPKRRRIKVASKYSANAVGQGQELEQGQSDIAALTAAADAADESYEDVDSKILSQRSVVKSHGSEGSFVVDNSGSAASEASFHGQSESDDTISVEEVEDEVSDMKVDEAIDTEIDE